MEILNFTDQHNQFRRRLKLFFQNEVTPYVDQWEKDGIVPKSVWKKMGDAGFLCPGLPQKYGGIGGDFLYSVIVAEEIVKTNQYGLIAFLHSDIVVPYIHSFGSDALKKKYLPGCASGDTIAAVAMTEPNAGSDLASISTTAVENGDHVVIEGSKIFISNGINCGLVVVAAKDPCVENPYKALSLYVVEDKTPGFIKGNRLEKMGFHSQDTAEIFFSKCKIPKSNIIGEKGNGFYYLMDKLQQERLVCSIAAISSAEGAFEETVKYYNKTKASFPPDRQSKQFAIVDMATDIKLGKMFICKLIADHMEGRNVVTETSMAKYWTTEMVRRVADRCLDIFGINGSLEKFKVERYLRDTRSISIFAGTNEIMRQIISKNMGL